MNEESVFAAALEKTPADRAVFLDGVCAADPVLRAKVASLLQAHEEAGGFLEPGASRQVTLDQLRMLERPGAMVGPYRLMEEIGEGGFGVVFVAEQQQPLRRKVALKLIKPGMDTKQVIVRFEAERQALAMMEHPNIAKVLDAGTTDSGHPYFAMELVKGIAITEYCDRNRLTIDERLALFVQVCRAIQHAHQKGIIHRDIKPSNVLVTLHDGEPVPKVIDFGVAKAINARLTDKTIYTQHLQVIGTLLYMSPEQAELSGLDIDTRSDIYALGVLLYELLTGTTPFQDADLRRAGFDEQRRIIREQEPPRLSVRISSLRETATAVAEQRKTDAKRLHQQVRGDLDWMVLKALEKDRTRRYGTAADFAQDVERHLANEPVVACPPSLTYRVRKCWRRNHLALSVAIFVVTLLGIGVSITLWKTYESWKHLQAFRDLAFQRTMNAAILGDREFLEGFVQAEDVNISEEWRHFFHGLVCFYDGRMNEAVTDFTRSLEIEENNMAACAMLALSFMSTHDWDEYFACRSRLESMSPRANFEEYDRFFYSLNYISSGSDDAGLALCAFLTRHPNSALARLCDTRACYATAQMRGDLDLARTNVDRNVVVIEELLEDTPCAQANCLMAYAIFIQLAEEATRVDGCRAGEERRTHSSDAYGGVWPNALCARSITTSSAGTRTLGAVGKQSPRQGWVMPITLWKVFALEGVKLWLTSSGIVQRLNKAPKSIAATGGWNLATNEIESSRTRNVMASMWSYTWVMNRLASQRLARRHMTACMRS